MYFPVLFKLFVMNFYFSKIVKLLFFKACVLGVEDTVPYFDRILVIRNRKIYYSDTLELQGLFTFGFVNVSFIIL